MHADLLADAQWLRKNRGKLRAENGLTRCSAESTGNSQNPERFRLRLNVASRVHGANRFRRLPSVQVAPLCTALSSQQRQSTDDDDDDDDDDLMNAPAPSTRVLCTQVIAARWT